MYVSHTTLVNRPLDFLQTNLLNRKLNHFCCRLTLLKLSCMTWSTKNIYVFLRLFCNTRDALVAKQKHIVIVTCYLSFWVTPVLYFKCQILLYSIAVLQWLVSVTTLPKDCQICKVIKWPTLILTIFPGIVIKGCILYLQHYLWFYDKRLSFSIKRAKYLPWSGTAYCSFRGELKSCQKVIKEEPSVNQFFVCFLLSSLPLNLPKQNLLRHEKSNQSSCYIL